MGQLFRPANSCPYVSQLFNLKGSVIVVCRIKLILEGSLPDARDGFGDPSDLREYTDNAARKGCTRCSWGSVSTNGSLADIPVEPKRGATNPRLARKAQLRGGTFDSNDWSGRSHDGAKHGRMDRKLPSFISSHPRSGKNEGGKNTASPMGGKGARTLCK